VSVGIGGVAANILEARERRNSRTSTLSKKDLNDDSESEGIPIISEDNNKEVTVKFPTLALFTSLSITVIKFFYFETALAAHEYLFSRNKQ
jgi:hypothetical protein